MVHSGTFGIDLMFVVRLPRDLYMAFYIIIIKIIIIIMNIIFEENVLYTHHI